MKRLILLMVIVLVAGCRSTIEPLGSPVETEMLTSSTTRTLEYRIPTIDVYECPIHGKGVSTFTISSGKVYCMDCLVERVAQY